MVDGGIPKGICNRSRDFQFLAATNALRARNHGLAESLQVAAEAGAKRLLLPMASVSDIPTIPGELFAKFQTSFYADPRDAVFKALGVQ